MVMSVRRAEGTDGTHIARGQERTVWRKFDRGDDTFVALQQSDLRKSRPAPFVQTDLLILLYASTTNLIAKNRTHLAPDSDKRPARTHRTGGVLGREMRHLLVIADGLDAARLHDEHRAVRGGGDRLGLGCGRYRRCGEARGANFTHPVVVACGEDLAVRGSGEPDDDARVALAAHGSSFARSRGVLDHPPVGRAR